jgi:hypothetical protein
MPRDEGRVGLLLDEEIGRPAEQIGTVEVLHRIENLVVPDELRKPGEEEMRFVPEIAAQRSAGARLKRFESAPIFRRGVARHHPDRRNEALLVVLRDLVRGQHLRHVAPLAS